MDPHSGTPLSRYCAPGVAVVASDLGYDIRSRFRLNQGQITGKCLRMRAHGFSVPPGGATFYAADYFHSGDASQH